MRQLGRKWPGRNYKFCFLPVGHDASCGEATWTASLSVLWLPQLPLFLKRLLEPVGGPWSPFCVSPTWHAQLTRLWLKFSTLDVESQEGTKYLGTI